jgi:hypothetical protein
MHTIIEYTLRQSGTVMWYASVGTLLCSSLPVTVLSYTKSVYFSPALIDTRQKYTLFGGYVGVVIHYLYTFWDSRIVLPHIGYVQSKGTTAGISYVDSTGSFGKVYTWVYTFVTGDSQSRPSGMALCRAYR